MSMVYRGTKEEARELLDFGLTGLQQLFDQLHAEGREEPETADEV